MMNPSTQQVARSSRGDIESELLYRYHVEGDLRARQELIERMLPFVRRVARRYAGRGEPLDDLIQVGCIGLLKAIDRFDVSRGVRLTSFAEPNVAGEIKRHFRDNGWSVHMPRNLQELHAEITRARERLGVTLGRPPTVRDLAEHLEAPPERIVEAVLGARSYRAASLDEPDDETGESRLSTLGGRDEGYEKADSMMMMRAGAEALPPREREIVYLRYFHDLPQHEIAARVGISQMHVSRLLRRSLEMMRRQLEQEPAAERRVA
jgi:RNA polymerase sigma-B factor